MCPPLIAAIAPAMSAIGGAASAGATALGGWGSVLGLVGSGISAIGSINSGKAQAQAARATADAQMQQAADARDRGEIEENRQRRVAAQFAGTQRATIGSQLVEMDSGSPLDLLSDTAMLAELDALTIRNNAAREAYGYEAQAGVTRLEGQQAKRAGYFSAADDLLGGIGSAMKVAPKWYDKKSELSSDPSPDGISTIYGSQFI